MAPCGMQAPLQAAERMRSTGGMLNDIWDTPKVLREILAKHLKGDGSVEIPGLRTPLPSSHGRAGQTPLEVMAACSHAKGTNGSQNKFTIIGSGSSWHAALLAEYLIEHTARIPVECQYASEFRFRQQILHPGDIVVVVSNSGETVDAVESLRNVRGSPNGKSVLTVAVVNEVNSTIARECDFTIGVGAGTEVGVATTKGFTATGCIFSLLAVALGQAVGSLSDNDQQTILRHLQDLPQNTQEVLDRESKPLFFQEKKFSPPSREGNDAKESAPADKGKSLEIGECALWDVGCQNVLSQNFIFLGRGFNFPIALEGAMKCKELAYIHAEGYPAAEMKHGPIALIDRFMPVVVIAPRSDPSFEKIKANIEEVKARSGFTIAITEKGEGKRELQDLCDYVIEVPETHEYLMPLIAVIPLQLLAYMMGILRGNEVDNPTGLIKSISKAATASFETSETLVC